MSYKELVKANNNYNLTISQKTSDLLSKFENWVLQLNERQDLEAGAGPNGALNWLHKQNNKTFDKLNDLFQTFIFYTDNFQTIIGTITLCQDDRDIGKTYQLYQDAMIGFFQVDREFRKLGIGKFILNYIDSYIADYINKQKNIDRLKVILFTNNNVAKVMYENIGYAFIGNYEIADFDTSESLYQKEYLKVSK